MPNRRASERQGRTAETAGAEERYDALKKFARGLTQAAKDGKLDPVIGRDEESRRTIQILARRTKNNPALIGEPGFYGRRDVARPGSIALESAAGRWRVILSARARIRVCQPGEKGCA